MEVGTGMLIIVQLLLALMRSWRFSWITSSLW